jgi:hypothetical protein
MSAWGDDDGAIDHLLADKENAETEEVDSDADEDSLLEELENRFFECQQPAYVKIVQGIRAQELQEPELIIQLLQDVREGKPNLAQVAGILHAFFCE